MKKGAIIISTIFLFSGFVFINSADLYTKKQIYQFSERLISKRYSTFSYKYRKEKWNGERVISLADLLYYNIHINKPLDAASGYDKVSRSWGYRAGDATPKSYQDGFRKILANNPDLAFTSKTISKISDSIEFRV